MALTNQIIAIGFVLGVMNQCLQRILPYAFTLVEARYGSSTLQNYEGLMRWSPLSERLKLMWRTLLLLLLILPLALSVLYKRFSGGTAMKSFSSSSNATYLPTGPPGMQDNISGPFVMANATAPFLSAARDEVVVPSNLTQNPEVYGFNIILLSDTSAAAIDGPDPAHIKELQGKLDVQASYRLTATVRGTVAQANASLNDRRSDKAYWKPYEDLGAFIDIRLDSTPEFRFGIMHKGMAGGDNPWDWDNSWIFVGSYPFEGLSDDDLDHCGDRSRSLSRFKEEALRFDVQRHTCTVTWQITRSSINLVAGKCATQPLPKEQQYYSQAQGSLDSYMPLMAEASTEFIRTRKQSQWRVLTNAVLVASTYQSKVAGVKGLVEIQRYGIVWRANPSKIHNLQPDPSEPGHYFETYTSDETLELEVATLKPALGLCCVLAIQPALTLAAYLTALFLYRVPISRTFGMVSLLGGADRGTLDLLEGAEFSGQLTKNVGVKIEVADAPSTDPQGRDVYRVRYTIGSSGTSGSIRRRRIYG